MQKKILVLPLVLFSLFTAVSCIPDIKIPEQKHAPLRATPVASTTKLGAPLILDSYRDFSYNYYLIDVGYIKNTYVSTMSIAHYNGTTPISSSFTTVTEKSVAQALTNSVSDSVTITNENEVSVSLGTSYEANIGVHTFGVELELGWKGTWGNVIENVKSVETSIESIQSVSNSSTISFTVGSNDEAAGWYRYAMYATCDVYFVLTLSRDNATLHNWDTVTAAREGTYLPHFEYSPNGTYDCSPNPGDEIDFSEGFYKSFPQPTSEQLPPLMQNTYETKEIEFRNATYKITDAGIYKNPMDIIKFADFDVNVDNLINLGFRYVDFLISLNVREVDDGYQYIHLYKAPSQEDKHHLASRRFEHSPGSKDTNWYYHHEEDLGFNRINLMNFGREFVLRYSADGSMGDTWENKGLMIQLFFYK